jgi:hypothetical protein
MPKTKSPTSPSEPPLVVSLTPATPPPNDIEAMTLTASSITTIATDAQYQQLVTWLPLVRDGIKQITAHYDAILKPINTAVSTVRTMRAEQLAPWALAEDTILGRMKARDNHRKQEAEDERRRLQAKADADAAAERQRQLDLLKAQEQEAKDKRTKQSLREQRSDLAEAPIPTTVVRTTAPRIGSSSIGTRANWKGRIVQRDRAIAHAALPLVIREFGSLLADALAEQGRQHGLDAPKLLAATATALMQVMQDHIGYTDCVELDEARVNAHVRREERAIGLSGVEAFDDTVYQQKRGR